MKRNVIILTYSALIIAVLLFSLGPNIVKLMVTMGGRFGLEYPGAVSFCNVLFVGNLCAALVTGIIFGIVKLFRELWSKPIKIKLYLLAAACLSIIYPALIFIGLEYTTVINIVIISRLNAITYIIFGLFIFKIRLHWQEAIGYAIISISVFIMLFFNNSGFNFTTGDIIILCSTVFAGLTEIVSGKMLPHCSEKAYTFFRNLISAIVFFLIVIIFYNPQHFVDVFKGELWIIMLIYAAIAIVLAQLLWLFALKKLPITIASNVKLFDPIFTIAFAYILLHETPNLSQFIIILVIILSVAIPKLVLYRKNRVLMTNVGSFGSGLVGK